MIHKKAYAKLDLAIHIEPRKLKDGFFPVHYVDCQIALCDELFFEKQEEKIEIICQDPVVPKDEDNFIYQAASFLKEIAGDGNLGTKITLIKRIPQKAGFGGGSSDAAVTLVVLSRLWKIKLDEKKLKDLARKLGKDFYYSLYGNLCEVIGRGKKYQLSALASGLPKFWLLVVVPQQEKPSTGWVYEHLKKRNIGANFDKIKNLKRAIQRHDRMGILANLTNDFEDSVSESFPIVVDIKDDLERVGAQASLMAGAGLSVVGFFDSKKKAQKAKQSLEGRYRKIYVSYTIS